MNYRILNAGEVRQPGDQVRHKFCHKDSCNIIEADRLGEWRPATLLSHPILSADLVVCEFRRPV